MSKLKKYSLLLMAIVMVAVSALTVYAADPTTGSLTIIVHEQKNGDTTTNPVMAGIEYTLYKVDETCEYAWEAQIYVRDNSITGTAKTSGADGKIEYDNLELGRYYATVTDHVDGVTDMPENFLVDIPTTNAQGTGYDYDITVEPKVATAFGNLELTKVDAAGKPIEGVTFKVQVRRIPAPVGLDDATSEWEDYIPEGETTVLTVTTDEDGKITLNNLPQSYSRVNYRLVEVSAPEGYIVNNGIIPEVIFYVNSSGVIEVSTDNLTDEKQAFISVQEGENLTQVEYINEKPSITKTVKNSVGKFVDVAGLNATDRVTFKIIVDVPLQISQMETFNLKDDLPEGLVLDPNTILTVEGTTAAGTEELLSNHYSVNYEVLELDMTFYPETFVDEITGELLYSAIIITYDAAMDMENITIGGNGNINTATLQYTNKIDEDGNEESTTTITDTAEVHTGALKIEKVEKGNTSNKLAGAKFKIATTQANAEAGTFVKDVNGNDIEVETNANGLAEIKGLAYADDGSDTSYWLVETQAPTYEDTVDEQTVTKSYNLLQNPVEVQIGKTTYDTAVIIQNSKGLDLPATGGIGIAIFAVVGITLMVISKKMNKEEVK